MILWKGGFENDRNEYMEQLKKYLKRLPKEDYDNAIEYFRNTLMRQDLRMNSRSWKNWENPGSSKGVAFEPSAGKCWWRQGQYLGEKNGSTAGSRFRCPGGGVQQGRMPMIPQKIAFPGEDHPPCHPGPLCVTSQSGTSDQCADSTVCSSCCDRISDLFPGCDKCCSDSRRNPACRFWCDADTEVRGSSVYDGRQRISYGRRRDPDRNSYHIYL